MVINRNVSLKYIFVRILTLCTTIDYVHFHGDDGPFPFYRSWPDYLQYSVAFFFVRALHLNGIVKETLTHNAS